MAQHDHDIDVDVPTATPRSACPEARPASDPVVANVLRLQRAAGNRAVVRALQRKPSDPIHHKTITASVGRNASNIQDDVATIQTLLNHVPPESGGPATFLGASGETGTSNFDDTLKAILSFQVFQEGLVGDGRVDPRGATLSRLNTYDSSFSRIDPSEIGIPPDVPPPEVKHDGPRGISTREHNLLKDVYGDHLDYGKIQLVPNALLGTGSTRTVGNTIEFQHDTISDHTLVHEAGHVYQYQRGDHYAASALWAQGVAVFLHWDRGAAYDYSDEVAKRVPFDNWNAEQQAQWIADNRTLPPSRKGETGYP